MPLPYGDSGWVGLSWDVQSQIDPDGGREGVGQEQLQPVEPDGEAASVPLQAAGVSIASKPAPVVGLLRGEVFSHDSHADPALNDRSGPRRGPEGEDGTDKRKNPEMTPIKRAIKILLT